MTMQEISYHDLDLNAVESVKDGWLIVSSGNPEMGWNQMTVSWGSIGCIWNRPAITVYIRPQRYTRKFIDGSERFTVSVFDPQKYRKELQMLGTLSGRDCDKLKVTGIAAMYDEDVILYPEAELNFVCRTMYQAPIRAEGFREEKIRADVYPEADYHDLYIGEIERILKKI